MFRVDVAKNRLHKLDQTTFSKLRLREREHLQEWIAEMPEALGEALGDELLIIQKEFDGFDGTRERLDLLALDRNGQLVVIENKLDDSGRDVAWQALKYAAYCSSLTKSEIVDIFESYLSRHGQEGDAATKICNFLRKETLDELVLNEGSDQRVVFVAANFRREVTATTLWLREHGIDARCIRIVPHVFGEELFVDLQQVIPPPEVADYMIRVERKNSETKSAKVVQQRTQKLRQKFWVLVLEAIRAAGLERWQNISPSRDNWISASVGVPGCRISLLFNLREIRVELQIDRPDPNENKWLFDCLSERREELAQGFGDELDWRRLDDNRWSLIVCRASRDGQDEEQWPEMVAWLRDHYQKIDAAFVPTLRELASRMPAGGTNPEGTPPD